MAVRKSTENIISGYNSAYLKYIDHTEKRSNSLSDIDKSC